MTHQLVLSVSRAGPFDTFVGGKVGLRSDVRLDIMNMKQEDFNKLDETALAKLRGDIA